MEKFDIFDMVKEMVIDGFIDFINVEGEEKMEVEGRIFDGLIGVWNEVSGMVIFEF